jgi:hypothetical protein
MSTNNDDIEDENINVNEDLSSMNITHPFNPNEIEIETPPFTVGYLVDIIEHNEINMNTEFQREGNLWSDQKQSRLIESILLGLPLPAFYFDTSNPQWDIIDGLQRCCSIENFCVKKKLKLTGLEFLGKKNGEIYLEGKGFDDLDRTLQRNIITKPITVNKIKKASKNVRFILFRRLNTGGLELTAPEIRNAIYRGLPADIISELSKSEEFINTTEGRIPTKRMQDKDFISRYMAFYLIDYQKYEPSLDDFVNSCMDLINLNNYQQICSDFKKAMKLAFDIFENDAFRKRNDLHETRKPINKAYFEVIAVIFAKLEHSDIELLKQNKDIFKKNLITLMNNSRYSNSISGGTGTKDSVIIRFSWFKQVLNKSIKGIKISITHDNKIEDYKL